jgi:transposase
MSAKKHLVSLTDEERDTLTSYLRSGVHSTRFLNRVRVLLQADDGQGDPEIARQVGVSKVTAYNIRRRFATEGLQAALTEKPRSGAPRKLTGQDKANVVLLACTDAPNGRTRWTHRLLADKLVELETIPSISYKSVERILKKMNSSPGNANSGASGPSPADS